MGTPIGRILKPSELYGREAELARAWEILTGLGSNLLFKAPRRVGKSSFLKYLEHEAPEHGFVPVYITLPDCQSEDQFVRSLLDACWDRDGKRPLFERFRTSAACRLLERIRAGEYEFKPANPQDWHELTRSVSEMLTASEEPKLFLIDELPLFVAQLLRLDPERARARRFLGWMKTLREDTRMRWVLAGSIGLDTIARGSQLSGTIADLYIDDKFGPFTAANAEAFLRREAGLWGLAISSDEVTAILALTGPDYHIPYYLLLLFDELRRARSEGVPFSEVPLLDKRTHFDHWGERIDEMFGAGSRDQIYLLLGEAAQDPAGIHKDHAIARLGPADANRILDILANDGYLRRVGDRYPFRCELIRRYWVRFIAQ